MRQSDSIANLATALCAAQAEMPAAPKDAKNDHLRNKYATLGSIISTVQPILARHGLSYAQMPTESQPGYMALTTRLMHSSGEWIEATMTAAVPQSKLSEIQAAGSVISYMRRYALSAALGVMTDDDDGAAASRPPQKAQPQPARTQSRPAPTQAQQDAPPQGADPVLNSKQAESLHARLGMALKGTDWDGQDDKAFAADVLGFKISSFTELKLSEARQLSEAAEKLPKLAA